MDSGDETKNGEERQHAEVAALSVAERSSGEDQHAAPHSDEFKLPEATLHEESLNAKRRRAERRQSSVLIALWADVERRSGKDQRASHASNDIEGQ